MTRRLQGVPPSTGDAEPLEFRPVEFRELSRFRAAAHLARRVYPGSLGELVQRELTAYADFGYRFAGDALVHRLAAEVLATSVADRADDNGCVHAADRTSTAAPEATRSPADSGRRRIGCTRI